MSEYKNVNLKIPLTAKQIFKAILISFLAIGLFWIIQSFTVDDVLDKIALTLFGTMMLGITFLIFITAYCSIYEIDRNPFHYIGYCVHFVLKECKNEEYN